MFERYTEKSRRVVFQSRAFASELGSDWIEPQHLLLGILKEEPELFLPWVKTDEELRKMREELRYGARPEARSSTSVDMPVSATCKRVLAHAAKEMEMQSAPSLRPSHLLAALLQEPSLAATVLQRYGVEIQKIRMTFVASLKHDGARVLDKPDTADLHKIIDELPSPELLLAREMLQWLRDRGRRLPE